MSHGFSLFFLLSLIFRVPSSLISHSPYTHKTFFLCGIKKATMDDRTLRLPLIFSVFLFFTCQIMGYSYSCPKKKPNKNLKNLKKICDKKKLYRHNLVNNLFFNMQKLSRLGVILSFNGQNIPNPIKLRKILFCCQLYVEGNNDF